MKHAADTGTVERLDESALARLRELDPDGRHGVLERILLTYETTLARMLVQLEAEREDGDVEMVRRVAHTLKSSSGSVGALSMANACADVERRLAHGGVCDMRADVERLLAVGAVSLQAVEAMLRG